MAEARQRQRLGVQLSSGAGDALDRGVIVGGLIATALVLVGAMFFLDKANLDVWTATITCLVILALSVPLFRRIARSEQSPKLYGILMGGLVLKFASSLVRYFVIFVIYDSEGDAGVYHEAGAEFVRRFREGIPIHPLPIIRNFPIESQRLGDFTGGIYLVTGSSAYAGFFVYTFLCFIGQILFVRALKAAVPEADHLRYARILLFLPSLLFWPSSIGKEALMIFCLGLISYGAALLLSPKPRVLGAGYFAAGVGLVMLVRPHIALMSIGALILATAVGAVAKGDRVGGMGRAVRLAALIGLLLAVGVVSTAVGGMFDGSSDSNSVALSSDGTSNNAASQLDETLARTSIGNSEFAAPAVTSPQKLPWAVVSVLLRPFPWEASSINSLIAASEGILLGYLFVSSWRRLARFPTLAARRPYLVFLMAFVLVFSVAFSFVGNFGILARQRTQMLPAAVALLALPAAVHKQRRRDEPQDHFDGEVVVAPLESLATVETSRSSLVPSRLRVLTVPTPPEFGAR